MMNEAALAYWKHNRYSSADLDAVCLEINNTLAARFDLMPGKSFKLIVSDKVGEIRQGHVLTCARFIEELFNLEGAELRGPLLYWLEDYVWNIDIPFRIPVCCFSRYASDTVSILVPDPAFLEGRGYEAERQQLSEMRAKLPWQQRQPTVFWRGAGSGISNYPGEAWIKAPRVQLALESKRIADPKRIDACISKVVEYNNNPSAKLIPDLDILGEPLPFADFLSYRYLIDIDGETCAWKSLFLKLISGSVVLKVQSNNVQWYYDRIIPWVHYVPIKSDLSNLEEIVDWVNNHDDACREIAANALALMESVTYESVLKETLTMLQRLLSCCTDASAD